MVLLATGGRISLSSTTQSIDGPVNASEDVAARVGESVLLRSDLVLAGIQGSSVNQWVEDELLAELAVQRGLENLSLSRLVQNRARQLYLRDELLENAYSTVPFPGTSEVLEFMMMDSLHYMVERHYYHILLADRHLADSIYTRLSWGESFQLSAERLSIGQKAGLGGDLGFLTSGELTAMGIPREQAMINGLGDILQTEYGWHILLVDDIRPLTDTSRAVWTIADFMYRQRLEAVRDGLIQTAMENREVYIDSTLFNAGNGLVTPTAGEPEAR